MTTHNFGFGEVPAHRHSNGGGWVADTAKVADTAYVGVNACVYGNAIVSGYAQVFGIARMSGDARLSGNAYVTGNALVCGSAVITKTPPTAQRSDGYTFTVFNCSDDIIRISAGCRYFTITEAIEHWTETRGNTQLGKESLQIIDHLLKMLSFQN